MKAMQAVQAIILFGVVSYFKRPNLIQINK